ncbi:type II toxin-antitoxin system ParD family antitoxin [Microvirga subterranea]|uniref:type II toxin-antitoxin system ParD family antitoxin n=1 Tax=Microvirga subterranea TaxID=186651 RepID=UPI000E0C0533|nr:type II toxin-antitoxin system ParD family antitoxin [Microvirga subterranea]
MANRISQNISLTAELSAFIASRVASGDYQSASEVVRAALRLLQRDEAPNRPEQRPPRVARTRHAGR